MGLCYYTDGAIPICEYAGGHSGACLWYYDHRLLYHQKQQLDVDDLFDDSEKGAYHYQNGFNRKAIAAWLITGYVAVGTVWPQILPPGLDSFFANLGGGGGYAWIIGAALGAVVHLAISKR